jgi:hypothetical protein
MIAVGLACGCRDSVVVVSGRGRSRQVGGLGDAAGAVPVISVGLACRGPRGRSSVIVVVVLLVVVVGVRR